MLRCVSVWLSIDLCHSVSVATYLSGEQPRRSVKAPDGKTHYLPCSPGEPGATAATLATLAENGLAENVRPVPLSDRRFPCLWQP